MDSTLISGLSQLNSILINKIDSVNTVIDTLNTHLHNISIKSEKEITIQIVSLSVALLAVFFGPLIQYIIAKSNYKISLKSLRFEEKRAEENIKTQLEIANNSLKERILSANRQDWIKDLRNLLSELISLISASIVGLQTNVIKDTTYLDRVQRIMLLKTQINMMLNPEESVHYTLIQKLDLVCSFLNNHSDQTSANIIDIIKDIVSVAQDILKAEWEKAKKLE